MAISALELFGNSEQLPSVHPELSNNSKELENKNGELISRQAAIEAIKELCEHYTPTKSVDHPHMNFVIEELQKLPSVQPWKGEEE